MKEISDQKLAPGKHNRLNLNKITFSVASVNFGGQQIEHAMVLDTYDVEREVLIFKNTFDDNGSTKQFIIKSTDPKAPKEFYFVHIEVDDIPSLEERRAYKKQELKARMKSYGYETSESDSSEESFEETSDESSGKL